MTIRPSYVPKLSTIEGMAEFMADPRRPRLMRLLNSFEREYGVDVWIGKPGPPKLREWLMEHGQSWRGYCWGTAAGNDAA